MAIENRTGDTQVSWGEPTTPRLPSLTGLRFPAALMVFVYHSSVMIPTIGILGFGAAAATYSTWATHTGAMGVSFFFILSGFVLAWSQRDSDTPSFFWLRRAAKIIPPYLAAFVLALLLIAARDTSVGTAILHLFMLQAWSPDFFTIFAINPPGWSLGVEAFFYLLFPFTIVALRRLPTSALGLTAVVLALISVAIPALAYALLPSTPRVPGDMESSTLQYYLVYALPLSRLPDFLLGSVLALTMRAGKLPKIPMPVGLISVLVAYAFAQAAPYLYGQRTAGVLAGALLVTAAAQSDVSAKRSWLTSPTAVWLGNVAFAFYLLHFIVIVVALKWIRAVTGREAFGIFEAVIILIGILAVTVLLSWLLYRLVELPTQRILLSRHRAKWTSETS